MSCYAPNAEVYHSMGALSAKGAAIHKMFELWLGSFRGPVRREVGDMRLHIAGDVGFAHALVRVTGVLIVGHNYDMRIRMTTGYRASGDRWLVVHQHASLPVDAENRHVMSGVQL